MTTEIELLKRVLAIGTDIELVNRSKKMHVDPVVILLVPTCEAALHYLKHNKDADEVWVYPSALDDRNPRFLEKAIELRHPKVAKVWFVATSFKEMMSTSPETNWWILEPDKQP